MLEKEEDLLVDNQNEEPSKVFTLDWSSKRLDKVPDVIQQYKVCKSLNLSCNKIKCVKEKDFLACTELKELKLYGNNLEEFEGLGKLRKLENLQVQYNHISLIGSSFKYSKCLKFLRIDNNRLSSLQIHQICSLSCLTYLDVSCNKLQDVNALKVLTSLEELHCTHNLLAKIADLNSLKRLCEVDISYNFISDLSGLQKLPRLTVLNIEHNRLASLESLGRQKSLQDLKLNFNQITDLKHVSEQCPNLELLHLSNNQVHSSIQVKGLLVLSSLRELQLFENPVVGTLQGKEEVVEILKALDLEYFDRINIKKVDHTNTGPPSAMRPMSANQMVSARLIEEQLNYSEMCMHEFKDKLNSQFTEIYGMFSDLEVNTSQASLNQQERPVSRCSSRARLETAMAFAAENF